MQPCRCTPSMHGNPPTFLHTIGEAAVAPPQGEFNGIGLKMDFSGYSALFLCLLKLKVLKNSILEGPGVDFRAPRARFWRPRASILEPPGLDFGGFQASLVETKNALWVFTGQAHLVAPCLEKSRLGGPWARFWSLRASILEPPGLDFRASGPRFSSLWALFCFLWLSLAFSCLLFEFFYVRTPAMSREAPRSVSMHGGPALRVLN